MCRILGITNFNYTKHKKLIDGFIGLAESGKVLRGDAPGHCDGWGIGYYKKGKAQIVKSGKSILAQKETVHASLRKAAPSGVLILHLRKSAWRDTSIKKHAHPFSHKNVLLAHNGTIRDYKKLLVVLRPYGTGKPNALDTEVYLHAITRFLSMGIEKAFQKAAGVIKKKNDYSSLTCLFSEGKKLYAYREYSRHNRYYTLYHARQGASNVVSSEPIAPDAKWKLLKKDKLYVY